MEHSSILSVHNWRCFKQARFVLPGSSFVLVDHNGSGKTSLVNALYTCLTSQSWPGTKIADNLQYNTEYFGIHLQSSAQDARLSGKVSPSGRVVSKYESSLDVQSRIKAITYLPTDNYWLWQSRSQKLAMLDRLLMQVNSEYNQGIAELDKLVKSKSQSIKNAQEQNNAGDLSLVKVLTYKIYQQSLKIWKVRAEFLQTIQSRIEEFSQWIELEQKNLRIEMEVADWQGRKMKVALDASTAKPFDTSFLEISEEDFENVWRLLWEKELIVGKVLYGAQRDDFRIQVEHRAIESLLSRGEMRLLVVFIKYMAVRHLDPDKTIWILDDVFNELDSEREEILFQNILNKFYFIATGTRNPHLSAPIYSMSDLTTTEL
jgi:DNA replication and repair protein RecF